MGDESIRDVYLKSIGLDVNKPTVLYAPTYSRGAFGFGEKLFFANSTNAGEDIDMFEALLEARENGFNIILRLHKYLRRIYGNDLIPNYLQRELDAAKYDIDGKIMHVCDNDQEPDSIPVLCSTDVLVTDFSSITADFLGLNRPIIFIEPQDHWQYTRKWHATKHARNNMGIVVGNEDGLVSRILEYSYWGNDTDYVTRSSLATYKYQPFFDGKCCERAWEGITREYGRRVLGEKIRD
jgi:CDP-glycerol glycerophosphotransferase (TagB/SpsB family)